MGEQYNSIFNNIFGRNTFDLGNGYPASFRQWSRDWSNFDWKEIEDRIINVPETVEEGDSLDYSQYIGLTAEELQEYMIWLRENRPEVFKSYVEFVLKGEQGDIPNEDSENDEY